jgi:hypothetical protein
MKNSLQQKKTNDLQISSLQKEKKEHPWAKKEPNHLQISSSLGEKKGEHTCLTLDERLRPNSSFF